MNPETWKTFLGNLRDESDPGKAGQAASDFFKMVDQDDLPGLLELLGEDDFFVREIAAVALCELNAIAHLGPILTALEKGFDDGHDNDSLQAALIDMAAMNKEAVKAKLRDIRVGADAKMEENIAWLLEFCD